MCKYASFVLTKDRVFWSKTTESHNGIIEEFNLCECDSTKTRINILRVEISPVKTFSDLSKWEYKVDQDLRPEWFDDKECERRTRKELKKKVDKKLLAAFMDLDKFIASITKVKFLQQHKPVKPEWKVFYGKTLDAARDAARAAAWAAARAAVRDAVGDAARAAAWATAWAAARAAARDAAGDAARDAAGTAAWAAARGAAWSAARDAAGAAAWDAARDAAGAAAWDAARGAAWSAARDAVGDAVGAAARDAVGAAARDAALQAWIIICKDLNLDKKHIDHTKARWDVWQSGYGLLCDVNGVFYVYGVK